MPNPTPARTPDRRGMLVLSRRPGESIVIGDDVVITVLEAKGDQVKVGIKAPRSVKVHRAELLAEIEDSNKAASSPSENAIAALVQRVSGS